MYVNLGSKKFSGVKPPDPHPKGRPRLTRPGRGASNAGRGKEGREGDEGKGGEDGEERGEREGKGRKVVGRKGKGKGG